MQVDKDITILGFAQASASKLTDAYMRLKTAGLVRHRQLLMPLIAV